MDESRPHLRLAILPHSDARVGGAEVDADDVAVAGVHGEVLKVRRCLVRRRVLLLLLRRAHLRQPVVALHVVGVARQPTGVCLLRAGQVALLEQREAEA